MRDLVWRIGFTLAILAALAMIALNIGCSPTQQLLERVLGQTPQAEITAYMTVIAEGDRRAALNLWLDPGNPNSALAARRQSVTDELLAYGPRLEHRVLEVEWWRTCCEPGLTDEVEQAGGARVWVAVSGHSQPERVYLFDLQVPGGYWGAAEGYPIREWAVVDIYPESAAPLAWTWQR